VTGNNECEIAIQNDLGAPAETRRMAAELIPLMYQDLRRIARRERMRVRAGVTLQTTALVHEAYLKLEHFASFNDEEHFLRACALAMRHILVNHARDRMARKRGGGQGNIPLDEAPEVGTAPDEIVVRINDALLELAALNPRLAQVVECRFFAGYDDGETARALGLTDRTVRRDWVKARAWLRRELGTGAEGVFEESP
jgi:RNA polymerase sigma factor (TIGR02999 family)